jgi:BirA family biotin operon repressor/biotin-[acetyl-CoA-carboxylase] ligase
MQRYRVIKFAELDSTSRFARENLLNLTAGDVIQATLQTGGYGRLCRRWISDVPGNLCISIVLKPQHRSPAGLPLANLSQLLSLSVCRALDAYKAGATLKWPNDVLIDGHKIAGLLAETVVQGAGRFQGMVIGLGVNLNMDAETLALIDQPATSLAAWLGRSVDVAQFRDTVLDDFFMRCDGLLDEGFRMIRDEYLQRASFIGSDVNVRRGEELISGRACGLTDCGALELRIADGTIRTIDLGEMFMIPEGSHEQCLSRPRCGKSERALEHAHS